MSTPFWVAGKPASSPNTGPNSRAVIRSPYDGSVAGEHDLPSDEDTERAVRAAAEVSADTAALPRTCGPTRWTTCPSRWRSAPTSSPS